MPVTFPKVGIDENPRYVGAFCNCETVLVHKGAEQVADSDASSESEYEIFLERESKLLSGLVAVSSGHP